MSKMLIIVALVVSTPILAADGLPGSALKGWQGPRPEKPPCMCRSKEGKVSLGTRICMRQSGHMVTMECSMVLNNTSWSKVKEGCDVAEVRQAIPR